MPFKYMLRLCLQPGFHTESKLQEAVDFCLESRIDDVIFFISVEELSKGFLTREETLPWIEMISTAKPILAKHGITTSINPWMTLGHADRGRIINPGLNFRRMVDRNGYEATGQACPLSQEWRSYIQEMYELYASIEPYMIWIDDDFRLHNHAPLAWGGCFCDLHLKEYSRRTGVSLTRDDFVKGILMPGEPHPYRKVWLDTSRGTMVDLASLIGNAVHRVSPETHVGLMSSAPNVHCAEGRDWMAVLNGFAGEIHNPANRPHLPAYSEVTGANYVWGFNAISRRTQAAVPHNTELYTELESFPDTRFTKSRTFTRYQMETSAVLGANGVTFNIFDMMGNGVMSQEGYHKSLADSKDFLNRITDLGLSRSTEKGVKVLTNSKSSYSIKTPIGQYIEEMYPYETFWASMLGSYGIANTYSIDELPQSGAAAISGQVLRNYSEVEIRDLFKNCFIVLEADAIETLIDLGLGDLAGIKSAVWRKMDTGHQVYEQVKDGRRYCGLDEARISCQTIAGDFLEIEYNDGAETKTVVKNPYGEVIANGVTEYDGRIYILPYGHFGDPYGMPHQTHMHPLRQEMLQYVLKSSCGPECPVFIEGAPYVSVYTHEIGGKHILLVVNSSGDTLDSVRMYAPGVFSDDVIEINRTANTAADISIIDDYIIWNTSFENFEMKALVFG